MQSWPYWPIPYAEASRDYVCNRQTCGKFPHHRNNHITCEIYSVIISMRIGHTSEVYIWLSNKLLCKIYIRDTLNYLNSRCNTAKLLWVVIYVVCYGRFSPDLVVMNICRQRLIKVKSPLWQRSLARGGPACEVNQVHFFCLCVTCGWDTEENTSPRNLKGKIISMRIACVVFDVWPAHTVENTFPLQLISFEEIGELIPG